jgi:hypothetical protein
MRSEFARGGLGVEVSHPCAVENAQGWGTQRTWLIEWKNADPSTALRSAQDDKPISVAQDDKVMGEGCR